MASEKASCVVRFARKKKLFVTIMNDWNLTAMRMCGAKMGRGKRLHQIGMQMRSGTRIIVKNADGKEKRRKHDRKELTEIILDYLRDGSVQCSIAAGVACDIHNTVINNAPTADVAPVVHGRWIWHEKDFEYECSACKCRFNYFNTYGIFDHSFENGDYCPNCSARMDGED